MFLNQLAVDLEDFKQENHIFLEDIWRAFIDNELFIPMTTVLALDAHVKELSGDGQEVVDILLLKLACFFKHLD